MLVSGFSFLEVFVRVSVFAMICAVSLVSFFLAMVSMALSVSIYVAFLMCFTMVPTLLVCPKSIVSFIANLSSCSVFSVLKV